MLPNIIYANIECATEWIGRPKELKGARGPRFAQAAKQKMRCPYSVALRGFSDYYCYCYVCFRQLHYSYVGHLYVCYFIVLVQYMCVYIRAGLGARHSAALRGNERAPLSIIWCLYHDL